MDGPGPGTMAKRLFSLRNVPADEADDIRALLDQHGLAWYETPASPWGISHGALWLSEDAQLERAKALLAEYQRQRSDRAREELQQAVREGRAETFGGLLRDRPVFVLVTLGAILFIVVLTLALPYLLIG